MAATLVNKIRSTARPSYLSILLTEYTPARRSSSMRLLQQPSPGVLSVVQLPQFATISSLTFVLPIYSWTFVHCYVSVFTFAVQFS